MSYNGSIPSVWLNLTFQSHCFADDSTITTNVCLVTSTFSWMSWLANYNTRVTAAPQRTTAAICLLDSTQELWEDRSRGRLPLADFLFIHFTGIWLPFPEQRRRFDWLRAGPSWYLSNHTLGLIHVKQARSVNSLITEPQHFITQQAKSLAGEGA